MKPYTFDFTIEAASPEEAKMKLTALSVLAVKLRAHELHKLAHVVANEPVKTAMAKKALGL
jgi:hypothetical protein